MPAYLITHKGGQRDDIHIDGDDLTLTFQHGWAVFTDTTGPCLAIPADRGATIQRIDPDQDGQETSDGPAPEG